MWSFVILVSIKGLQPWAVWSRLNLSFLLQVESYAYFYDFRLGGGVGAVFVGLLFVAADGTARAL